MTVLIPFVSLSAIFMVAWRMRMRFFGDDPRMAGFAISILSIFAAHSILQTMWYYAVGALNTQSDLLILALVMAGGWVISKNQLSINQQNNKTKGQENKTASPIPASILWLSRCFDLDPDFTSRLASTLILSASLLSIGFVLWQAWTHATVQAIRAPWPLLPHGTLAVVAAAGIIAIFLAFTKTRSLFFTGIAAAGSIGAITVIALLLYRNGYGYDGFIHRASEQVLLATGELSPKPPYYIGQYVFVTWIARLFQLPIGWIDKVLVPFGAMILPLFAFAAFEKNRRAYALAGIAFLLPFGAFIATTPQSFSYLLGLAAIFLSLGVRRLQLPDSRFPLLPSFLLALWAVAAHPLGGLPFFFGVLAIQWSDRQRWRVAVAIAAATLSAPIAFAFHSFRSDNAVYWNFSSIPSLATRLLAYSPTRLSPATAYLWADWASFVAYASPFVLALLAALAVADRRSQVANRKSQHLVLIFLAAGIALAGIALKTFGDFSFLIDYERDNYADRLFVISTLMMLPVALNGFAIVAERLFRQPKILALSGILLLAAWRAGAAYISLPRHDAAEIGHGWSVGRADQLAVRWIDEDAAGRPYTVLANQSVSAAAVEAFGFKRYAGDVFYYPVPTGGALYQKYLQMTERDPSRATAKEAASLGKSDLVYVALNDYWWNADRLSETLSEIADRSRVFENNRVRVYHFDFSNETNRDK